MRGLHSSKVIGWAMSVRMKSCLVCDAFSMALANRSILKGLIMYADRASQYCSKQYQRLLKLHQIICSMSDKGVYYDNAVCESVFYVLKTQHEFMENNIEKAVFGSLSR